MYVLGVVPHRSIVIDRYIYATSINAMYDTYTPILYIESCNGVLGNWNC